MAKQGLDCAKRRKSCIALIFLFALPVRAIAFDDAPLGPSRPGASEPTQIPSPAESAATIMESDPLHAEEVGRAGVLPVTPEELKSARNAQSNQLSGSAFDPALPLGVNGRTAFNYSALWAPGEPVENQNADLGFVRQNVGVSFPLWFGEGQSLFAGIGVQNLLFQTTAVLPDSGQPFPENLWDIRGSLVYIKRFQNDWSTVLIGSLGSTGDRPFAGSRELIGGLTGVLRIPTGEKNAWVASVSYQPITGLPFPIPGLAYVWEPSDNLTAQIGIPFQLYWRIAERLRFDASYLPVKNVRAYATYQLSEQIEFFGGFDWVNESYFLYDRVDSNDFFNLLEQRLPIGIRWNVGQNWVLDAQAGYLINREFFSGTSIMKVESDLIRVDPGPFGMLRLLYRF